MGLRQKLASVFLPAEPLAPSAFRKLYKRKIPPAYVRRIVPFTWRYARNDKSEFAAELDGVVSYRGYFPKITQMLISGPSTNATSSGIITNG